jgi:hypothetical protein
MSQPAKPSERPNLPDAVIIVPAAVAPPTVVKEFGGPTGPEPTRYGDWERNGRCSDF